VPDFSISQTIVFAALFGLVVGALFGGVQAFVLRRVARRTHIWVLGT
jgi:NhaP-type Na+/H+ or K+/H+ antiporter